MSELDRLMLLLRENGQTFVSKQTLDYASSELAQLRATVAEQARQLEEARPFAEYVRDNEMNTEQIYVNAKSWLAANPAPAPQAAQRRE